MLEHPLLAFMWEIVYRLVDIIPLPVGRLSTTLCGEWQPPRWAVEYDSLW